MATVMEKKDATEKNIVKLHHEMIHKLSGEISPDNERRWNEFINMMRVYINEAVLTASKNIFDICDELMKLGKISLGEYNVLLEVFRTIQHQPCQDIILECTRLITEIQNPQSPQKTNSDYSDGQQVLAQVEIDQMKSGKSRAEVYGLLIDICKEGLTKLKESNLPPGEVIKTMSGLRTETTEFMAMLEKLEKKEISAHDVIRNCLMFTFKVQSRKGLDNAWAMYNSGELLQILQEGLISDKLLKKCNAEYIQLKVYISEEDYQKCLNNIGRDMANLKALARDKGDNQCTHHQSEVTLSCTDCDGELICGICTSTLHNGHSSVAISEIIVEKKNMIQQYLKKAKDEEKQMKENLKFIDDKIQESSERFKILEREIIVQAEKMKADIDRITQEFVDKNSALQSENLETLSKCKHDTEFLFNQVKETIDFCSKILTSTNEILIIDTDINHLERELNLPCILNMKIGHFHAGLGIEGRFGTFDIKVVQEIEKLETYTHSTVLSQFSYSRVIRSVEKSTSRDMWVIGCEDGVIDLVNHEGNILDTITLGDVVEDISVSSVTGNLWLCLENDRAVYEMSDKNIISRFTTKSDPWSLCMTPDNNIVVGAERRLTVYSTTGKVLHTTRNSVTDPCHITVCTRTGNIAVCDYDVVEYKGKDQPYVSVFNSKLEIKHKYFGPLLSQDKEFSPLDAVYDTFGRLLIADSSNKCVQLVNSEGEFLAVVHADQLEPTALTMIQDGQVCICCAEICKIIRF